VAIQAVIFDLGGVIVRTDFPEVRGQLETELGLEPGTLERNIWGGTDWELAELGAISYDEYWRRVGATLGFSTPEEVYAFREEYFSGDRVNQELLDLIRELKGRYKIGLLSNAPDRLDHWLENHWQIRDLFDAIVYSAQVGIAKPDERIFHLILEQLNVLPSEAIFIDDFARNVEAALTLGMNAIRFTDTENLRQELRQHLAWGPPESHS
jgi:epoxide hydrolase-like predicted phosphatase